MTRTEAREQAFILIFEKEFNSEYSLNELIDAANESELFEISEFACELTAKTLENSETIDVTISENLKGGWKISRISKVSLAILRLAICEMKYFSDVPVSVSINEAVELAKKYASEDEYSFINGLLGAVSRRSVNNE